MAKITRETQVVFGGEGSSDNFAKFGSETAGTPVKTKNIATIQALDAWKNGLQDAVWPVNKAPFLEDVNSLFFVHSRQVAYIFQEGIAEWDNGTTYYIGSVVRKPGTAEKFVSLIDANVGNALPATGATNASWAGFDADTVGGFGVDDTATPLKILPLDADGKFPNSVFGDIYASVAEVKAGVETLKAVNPAGLSGAIGFSQLFQSAEQVLVRNTDITVAHGLGGVPTMSMALIRCVTAEMGYAVGDEVPVVITDDGVGSTSHAAYVDSANCGFSMDEEITVCNRATHARGFITLSSWRLVFRAWR